MPDNSTDIESDSLIKRYQRRPQKLQNICLADFVAWFNCVNDNQSFYTTGNVETVSTGTYLPETDFADNVDDEPQGNQDNETDTTLEFPMRGGMKLVKRKKPGIIRSVRYNKEKDPGNYYREQLMLYILGEMSTRIL